MVAVVNSLKLSVNNTMSQNVIVDVIAALKQFF